MRRAIEFSVRSDFGWRSRIRKIFRPLLWFSPNYRAAMRRVRAIEKAQKARNPGDTTAMERLWREDLARAETSANPLEKAQALSSVAHELMTQKRYAEAEEAIRQSEMIGRQEQGPAGFWSLDALSARGMMAWEQEREPEAETHFLEALHAAEKELGPDHHRVAFELQGLANFYQAHGRRADEIAVVERILAIYEKQADPQVAHVAQMMIPASVGRLAALYAREGRDAEAEALYRRVFELSGELKGGAAKHFNRSLLVGALHGYAKLLRKNGRQEEAVPYEKQFEKLMKKIDPKRLMPRDWLDRLP